MARGRFTIYDVDISINVNGKNIIVGGAESCSFNLSWDHTVAHEAGTHYPAEIVDGKVSISGSLQRAYIDNELIKELLGDGTNEFKPYFTLTGIVKNPNSSVKKVTIFNAKAKGTGTVNISDSYPKTSIDFDALGIKFE